MRTNKFRAWDGEKMQTSFVVHNKSGFAMIEVSKDNSWYLQAQPWDVMQFTGLLDKNGKEVYEGDIVLCDWWGEKHEVITVPVEWFGAGFYVHGLALNTMPKDTLEVIGNIYENPELLK